MRRDKVKSNYDNIKKELEKLISSSKSYKRTNRYKNEINIFLRYLEENHLEDRVLILKEIDIENYFTYCQRKNKLGSKSTLDTHISALKNILEYLIEKNYPYSDLLGYISTKDFRRSISSKLKEKKSKEFISVDDLKDILITLDLYIEKDRSFVQNKKNDKIWKIIFSRIYIN